MARHYCQLIARPTVPSPLWQLHTSLEYFSNSDYHYVQAMLLLEDQCPLTYPFECGCSDALVQIIQFQENCNIWSLWIKDTSVSLLLCTAIQRVVVLCCITILWSYVKNSSMDTQIIQVWCYNIVCHASNCTKNSSKKQVWFWCGVPTQLGRSVGLLVKYHG